MKRFILPIVVLALGIIVFQVLKYTKPEVKEKEEIKQGFLVDVVKLYTETHIPLIKSQGIVTPSKRVQLKSQVSGIVTWVNPKFIPGSYIKKNEILVKIDSRDYNIAIKKNLASVQRAQLALEIEEGRKKVAEEEWAILSKNEDIQMSDSNGLALRGPQLHTAKLDLKAAKANLEQSYLQLNRTHIKAPFDSTIETTDVDVGELVGQYTNVAQIVGVESYWVQISIPIKYLSYLDISYQTEKTHSATVWYNLNNKHVEYPAKLIRLLRHLDSKGRKAQLLVEIEKPLSSVPLLLNSYVNVKMKGKPIENVIKIPRNAITQGNRIYIYNKNNQLDIRYITIIWENQDFVWILEGAQEHELLVVSRIAIPSPSMMLRRQDKQNSSDSKNLK